MINCCLSVPKPPYCIFCTFTACQILHFCMEFISLNKKDVSKKKKDLRETQSVCRLSLLTVSEATSRQEYCENAFMPLQKDVRQTDAKTSLSLPLLWEKVYGFDIDISDSLLNPSIKKTHPCIAAFSTARRFLMWVVLPREREKEREKDTSLLSYF